jgi:hypothetical protein
MVLLQRVVKIAKGARKVGNSQKNSPKILHLCLNFGSLGSFTFEKSRMPKFTTCKTSYIHSVLVARSTWDVFKTGFSIKSQREFLKLKFKEFFYRRDDICHFSSYGF